MQALIQSLYSQWQQTSLNQWLQGLPSRDRLLVQLLALVAALTLAYLLIWQPVADWRAAQHQRYQQNLAFHGWLQQHEAQLRAARRQTGGGNLSVGMVANSAAGAGIQLNRVQPETGGIAVTLQEQEFNRLLAWLDRLGNQDRLSIRQLSIDAQPTPGMVSARININ